MGHVDHRVTLADPEFQAIKVIKESLAGLEILAGLARVDPVV